MIDENEPWFLKPRELMNDEIKCNIEKFKNKYLGSTPIFSSELLKKNKFEWKPYETNAEQISASDYTIHSHEYIKQFVDSFQIKIKDKEEEATHAAPEGQEFIFDPKELDI